ncbi:MAG: hypothetical protein CM15mP8_1810 [Methanobacteriota archaeon]|nr:MAG: hypothetical protein CM15mP8_1810 [Euryarchaeota archaeon]
MLTERLSSPAVLAESLSCKYELLEAIQNDNENLRGF